jgi:hypothetical protein
MWAAAIRITGKNELFKPCDTSAPAPVQARLLEHAQPAYGSAFAGRICTVELAWLRPADLSLQGVFDVRRK